MITFIHCNGQGSIGIEDDGSISVFVEGDDTLLKLLQEEAIKGIPCLKSFKTKGIPGKYKAFRKVEDDFEIVSIRSVIISSNVLSFV